MAGDGAWLGMQNILESVQGCICKRLHIVEKVRWLVKALRPLLKQRHQRRDGIHDAKR